MSEIYLNCTTYSYSRHVEPRYLFKTGRASKNVIWAGKYNTARIRKVNKAGIYTDGFRP